MEKELIIESVKDRYGAVARAASEIFGDTACCGEREGFAACSPTYGTEVTEGLPEGALAASAGCGNPNAIGELCEGETVVDFGSGGGIDCFIAAKAVGESGRVIGVDMTPDMVDLANRNKANTGVDNVEFRLARIDDTGIAPGSVDVVISNCVIVLAPDKSAVLKEAARILRQGGRLHVSDVVLTQKLPDHVSADMDNWTHCLAGAEVVDDYIGMMKDAGFDSVEIVSDAPYRWESQEDWVSCVRSMNILAMK